MVRPINMHSIVSFDKLLNEKADWFLLLPSLAPDFEGEI